MIRFLNVYFPARTLILGVSELILVYLAFTMAVIARAGRDADIVLADEHGIYKIAMVAVVYLLCMYYLDLYDTKVLSNRHEVVTRLLQVVGLGSVVLAIIYYAYPDAQLGRGAFILGLVFVLPFLIAWREGFQWFVTSLHLADNVLIIGSGPLAVALSREIRNRPELGLELVGCATSSDQDSAGANISSIGTIEDLPSLVSRHKVSRAIVAMTDRRGRLPLENLLSLKNKGLIIQDGADLYESITGKLQLESLRTGWLLFSSGFRVSPMVLAYKRTVSFVLSFITLVITLPIVACVAVAIRLDSAGPAIFRQKRVGKNGKLFTLYKFRTMVNGADKSGMHQPAQNDDERITRVGHWLRRARLDELPQLYNILRGDMDFVGPRPFVPDQEQEYVRTIPFYAQRWTVKPGATGWAQINYGYCASLDDNLEKTAYDLYYLKHMAIGLDLLIIFQTIKILLLGRGGR